MTRLTLTAQIYRDGNWFVSDCPDLGVASQGETIGHAREMLIEAVELTLEDISQEEYEGRLSGAYFANSAFTEDEIFEDCELVETGSITVNANLPFVPAR